MLDNLLEAANNLDPARARPVVLALLCAVLALALLGQGFSIYQTSRYDAGMKPAKATSKTASSSDYKAQSITQNQLFGQLDRKHLEGVDLPTTRLQLILRGAFTATDPNKASAIIESPDGKTRSYKIKSSVYGNARLHAVYPDRVVLIQGEQLETLLFPKPGTAQSTGSNSGFSMEQLPSDVQTLVRENVTMDDIQQVSKQLRSPTMTPEQRQDLIRSRLQELRSRSKK